MLAHFMMAQGSLRLSYFVSFFIFFLGFPGGSYGKESACSVGDLDSIPGLGRHPGEWKPYPLQYCGLKNSTDWIGHGVPKSRTQLSDKHFPFCLFLLLRLDAFNSLVFLFTDLLFAFWLLRLAFNPFAAAAKPFQSCPTRNPKDSSPPGSPVPGILQARTLEWVAISFSNA